MTPFSKIQLLAHTSELVNSAEALKDAAFWARKRAKELMKENKELGKQKLDTDEQLHQRFMEVHRHRVNFLRLARADLAEGVPDATISEEPGTLVVTDAGPTIVNPPTP
jgi:hypothetical protein